MRTFNCLKILSLVSILIVLTVGCSINKVYVRQTPKASVICNYQNKEIINGYPKYSQAWIVYSDRNKNLVYTNKSFEEAEKYSNFLEPFLVIRKKGNMFKVAKYKEGTIVENKIDRKLLKAYGWMHENDLLLWNGALRNDKNGFYIKGMLAINDKDVIENSAKYIENDSIIVYKDPSFLEKADIKLAFNDFVYIYKFLENKKKALIGGKPFIEFDNKESRVYGWVDTKILSIWGERDAIKISNTGEEKKIQVGIMKEYPSGTLFKSILSSNDINNQNTIYNLFPVKYLDSASNNLHVKFYTNVLDYSANRIYNVLGKPIYYNQYRDILKANKKINIAFVMDGSIRNKNNLSLVKSVLQDLEKKFENEKYFDKLTYWGQFYNTRACTDITISSFSDDYKKLAEFIEKEIDGDCQSISNDTLSLTNAVKQLSELLSTHKDEANVVVIIGNSLSNKENSQSVINNLISINAKTLVYQVSASRPNTYNNFVLFGEEIITKSANKLAEYKKTKLVNHNDVIAENIFSIKDGAEGIYRLEYPESSMIQGVVVFPKKGNEMRPFVLKQQLDNLINDIHLDNKHIDSTLTSYFKSPIGLSNTTIKNDFHKDFGITEEKVPTSIAIQLFGKDNAFLIDGILIKENDSTANAAIQKGLLLDEFELEKVHNLYLSVYREVFKDQYLSNKRIVKRYANVVKSRNPLTKKISKKEITKSSLHDNVMLTTGFYTNENESLDTELYKWKNKSEFGLWDIINYFKKYKVCADKLKEEKVNQRILINRQNNNLYWLNDAYLPSANQNTKN